jgi:DNA-binding transcriptional LysR family regulator
VQTFDRYRTPLNIVIELPSLDAIKRLVERGLGVALMPRRVAQDEIARGDLVAITVREMRFRRLVHVVYRDGADLSHAARAFLACAREAQREDLRERPAPARRALTVAPPGRRE